MQTLRLLDVPLLRASNENKREGNLWKFTCYFEKYALVGRKILRKLGTCIMPCSLFQKMAYMARGSACSRFSYTQELSNWAARTCSR